MKSHPWDPVFTIPKRLFLCTGMNPNVKSPQVIEVLENSIVSEFLIFVLL
ncbi:unnamed protein product [Callosobruchus maculatus]|uniref:Uncharacterized protein n=1 Tax=Callosobruchus maculatus TaxID=64391 RepID=A0A653CQ92_CALMS|nr:unnamed protein product [Callosobruchus maculatus]